MSALSPLVPDLITPPAPPSPSTTAPPPDNPASPPPQPVDVAPPPSPPLSPPPSSAPPPLPPVLPPPPPLSPPVVSSPPPVAAAPPPVATLPPPPVSAPPPPDVTPPPSIAPPPPEVTPPPSDSSPPPPPNAEPPKSSPPPLPGVTPPPSNPATPPPSTLLSPPPSTLLSPPPSVPSTSSPPPVYSPPAPPSNSSTYISPNSAPLPTLPTEKPTARATNDTTRFGSTANTHAGGLNTGGAVAIGIVLGFGILSFLVIAVWLGMRKKRGREGHPTVYAMSSPFSSPQTSDVAFLKPHSSAPHTRNASGSDFVNSQSESNGMSNSRSWFTYDELVQATDGFSAKNLLGEGGFGCVYKGVLTDGKEVAVKQLKVGGSQGEREFRAEVEIITRVHHRDLVSLVGYCISERERLLVYDYLPNNTLHYHLHEKGRPVMTWATRVKVAAGAARGIAYLHEDCHPRIIHRDIKSSNILLDNDFEARVSDFGLAKIAGELDLNTHISTRVMGTFGYMAPEYATSGKLTEKSDVYSFGVVLLELITGRKPVDGSQPLGDESLVEWARPLLAQTLEDEEFDELVDTRLEDNYIPGEMFRMIEAAAACVRHSATRRPKMSQVVRALDTLDEISDITNGMKPGQSQIYDSAQQSAQIRMFQRLAFGSQEYSSEFFDRSQQGSWKSRDYDSREYGSREFGNRSKYIP